MRRGKPLGSLALALALTASACGSTTDTSATAPSAVDPSTVASSEEVAALAGEFGTLNGASLDLATLNGEDVVLWFWAPW